MNPNNPNRFENRVEDKNNEINPQNPLNRSEQSQNIELSSQQRRNLSQNPNQFSQNVSTPNSNQTTTSIADPVQQVKSMISAGYTPSIQLIQATQGLLKNKKLDWSDTWFAVLLQKLLKENKK